MFFRKFLSMSDNYLQDLRSQVIKRVIFFKQEDRINRSFSVPYILLSIRNNMSLFTRLVYKYSKVLQIPAVTDISIEPINKNKEVAVLDKFQWNSRLFQLKDILFDSPIDNLLWLSLHRLSLDQMFSKSLVNWDSQKDSNHLKSCVFNNNNHNQDGTNNSIENTKKKIYPRKTNTNEDSNSINKERKEEKKRQNMIDNVYMKKEEKYREEGILKQTDGSNRQQLLQINNNDNNNSNNKLSITMGTSMKHIGSNESEGLKQCNASSKILSQDIGGSHWSDYTSSSEEDISERDEKENGQNRVKNRENNLISAGRSKPDNLIPDSSREKKQRLDPMINIKKGITYNKNGNFKKYGNIKKKKEKKKHRFYDKGKELYQNFPGDGIKLSNTRNFNNSGKDEYLQGRVIKNDNFQIDQNKKKFFRKLPRPLKNILIQSKLGEEQITPILKLRPANTIRLWHPALSEFSTKLSMKFEKINERLQEDNAILAMNMCTLICLIPVLIPDFDNMDDPELLLKRLVEIIKREHPHYYKRINGAQYIPQDLGTFDDFLQTIGIKPNYIFVLSSDHLEVHKQASSHTFVIMEKHIEYYTGSNILNLPINYNDITSYIMNGFLANTIKITNLVKTVDLSNIQSEYF